MRCANSIVDLWGGSLPAYLPGGRHVRWLASHELAGVTIWGKPSIRDTQELVATFDAEFQIRHHSTDEIVDLRHAEHIDSAAFQGTHDFVVERAVRLEQMHGKVAMIRPAGHAGCVVAGFYDVTPAPYETAVFSDVMPALRWMNRAAQFPQVAALAEEIRLVAERPPILRRLHALLDRQPSMSLFQVASQCGLAPRSLQYQLKRAGTTFREQQSLARLRMAQYQLANTNASVSTISIDVGCASPQHFSDWFRSATGCTPSAYRLSERA